MTRGIDRPTKSRHGIGQSKGKAAQKEPKKQKGRTAKKAKKKKHDANQLLKKLKGITPALPTLYTAPGHGVAYGLLACLLLQHQGDKRMRVCKVPEGVCAQRVVVVVGTAAVDELDARRGRELGYY
jgi:hypothetical protein